MSYYNPKETDHRSEQLSEKEREILSLFHDWDRELQTGDPLRVVKLYDKSVILLPTLSNRVRRNHDEIIDYFTQFLSRKSHGSIAESNIRVFDGLAVNSGVYTFLFDDVEEVQARFSFVYRWDGNKWLIIEHHSSKMPN